MGVVNMGKGNVAMQCHTTKKCITPDTSFVYLICCCCRKYKRWDISSFAAHNWGERRFRVNPLSANVGELFLQSRKVSGIGRP